MNVCLITEAGLLRTHGTGVQLLLLYQHARLLHLYLDDWWGQSEVSDSVLLNHPAWPLPRGSKLYKKTREVLGLHCWNGDQIKPAHLQKIVRCYGRRLDVAHVVVGSEHAAAKINSILDCLGLPYIVHVMDIYHDRLSPEAMPAFRKLFRAARGVIALTDAIAEEIAKFQVAEISRVFIGKPPTDFLAGAPRPGGPLRMALIGRPYPEGAAFLESCLEALTGELPNLEIHYSGHLLRLLPEKLKAFVRSSGFIHDETEFQKFLASCHLGMLTGPRELDFMGKYSFPSRVADYFMAGLPVIAYLGEGTAAKHFLQTLNGESVQIVDTPEELIRAVKGFSGADGTWAAASQAARQFALTNLSIRQVQNEIDAILARACRKSPQTVEAGR